MSIRRAYRALNAAGQALESRVSSLRCNLSIEKNNTMLKVVRIATMRPLWILIIKNHGRSNSV